MVKKQNKDKNGGQEKSRAVERPITATNELFARFNTTQKVIDDFVNEIIRHNRFRMYSSSNARHIIDDRSRLIDLYEMAIDQDAHIRSVIETLESQIIGDRYSLGTYNKNGDFTIDKEQTEKIQGTVFENAIRGIMEAKMYGYSLLEVFPEIDPYTKKLAHIKSVERRNVLPNQGIVLQRAGDWNSKRWDITSEWYRDRYIMINSGGLGLFSTTTPLVLAKKFTFGSYVNFSHTYGMPIIHAKSNATSRDSKQRMADSVANAVNDRIIVTNLDDTIDIKTMSISNSERIYLGIIEIVNRDISNVVLGSESMAGATQSYVGSTKAHQDIFRDRIEVYRKYIENHMNEQVIPRLKKFGYLTGDVQFKYNKTLEMSMDDKIKLLNVLEKSYTIPEEQILTEFGMIVEKKDFSSGGGAGGTSSDGSRRMSDDEYYQRYGKHREETDSDTQNKKIIHNYISKLRGQLPTVETRGLE